MTLRIQGGGSYSTACKNNRFLAWAHLSFDYYALDGCTIQEYNVFQNMKCLCSPSNLPLTKVSSTASICGRDTTKRGNAASKVMLLR